MNIKFKLRNGTKRNTILLDFRYGRNIRVRYSTNLIINKGSERYWDYARCRIKVPNDVSNYEYINDKLKEYDSNIEKAIVKLEHENRLYQENCDSAIKNILQVNKADNQPCKRNSNIVLEYFEWFIEYYTVNNSPSTNKPLKSGTLKTYSNAKKYFENYLKTKKRKNFRFEDIDKVFYHDFIQYGYKNGDSNNYIGTIITKLKTVIGSAYENDVHKNDEFKKRYFSKLTESINHPYLDEQELHKILKVKLTDQRENDVRDIFLIASYTGLRVGDLTKFLENPKTIMINDKQFIYLKQSKTDKEVYIPLNAIILKILKKRGGKFPPKVHPNIINDKIKPIVEKAKIKTDFTLERTKRGKKIKITKPKYKFISAHSARRSFCTNAYNAGMHPHQIMVISGHSSEKIFYNYIKTSPLTKAIQVSTHSFFD